MKVRRGRGVICLLSLVALLTGSTAAQASEWYAAPNGTSSGAGTQASPWNLTTALAGGPGGTTVRPGDTLWLRGGIYSGTFISTLTGSAAAPIVVRNYQGERAILDKGYADANAVGVLMVTGQWCWYWGFEITNSNPNRNRLDPNGVDRPWRGSGVDVRGPNNRFINLVIHDTGHGIGCWVEGANTEVYGCLIYYCGNNHEEHGIYTQTAQGEPTPRFFTDNLILASAGYGFHAYTGSQDRFVEGLQLEGNAIFSNGLLTLDDQNAWNVLIGGSTPGRRISLRSNCIYAPLGGASSKNQGIRLGYTNQNNQDVQLLDNYIVSRHPLLVQWWQSVQSTGNTIYSQGESTDLRMPARVSPSVYAWDRNTYWRGRSGGFLFIREGSNYDFPTWQQVTGLDRNSQALQNASLYPSGLKVVVRPNRYEAGRAHIAVYNWDQYASVAVDLSSLLPVGAAYEVRDAQDYFAGPVAQGVYNGTAIQLPMDLTEVAPPVGNVERVPAHTSREFGAFVLVVVGTPPGPMPEPVPDPPPTPKPRLSPRPAPAPSPVPGNRP